MRCRKRELRANALPPSPEPRAAGGRATRAGAPSPPPGHREAGTHECVTGGSYAPMRCRRR
eukprot:13060251-Alexandrium_andersonii.AAC.1